MGHFEAAVHAHNRIDRVRAVHGLRVEADAVVFDGRRRSETSEALLRALGQNVVLGSDINERAQIFHIRAAAVVAHLQVLHAGRDPVRLAMKYRAMRRSFGDFVRGTCSLFYLRAGDVEMSPSLAATCTSAISGFTRPRMRV